MDGQNYWLWIAYEPNTYTFVFVIFHIYIHTHIYIYIYQEKERFCLLSVLQADQDKIWKKETNIHRWRLLLV
jgi:IS1 family transposase